MGQTVYFGDEKIHFDLRGDHEHGIRIYDFENGEFNEVRIEEIRDDYSEGMQKEFFAELLRFSQGSFRKEDDKIIHEVKDIPLGAVFRIADKQENDQGEVANVQLNTMGSVTFRDQRILNITNETNRKLYEHFVTAMNNRVDTANLF